MKETHPLVSVIIPALNVEKTIARCLRSIFYQSFPRDNYEVIVIDDCSQDNSGLIIDSFGDRVIKLKNSSHKGLPYSLNKALDHSKGKYFIRLDADDFVNHHYILELYNFITMNDDYQAVACDYYLVDADENIIARKSSIEEPIGCGIIFETSCWRDLGKYDPEIRIHEEIDFRLRFEKKYTIGHVELPLYRYRRHSSNITNDELKVEFYKKQIAIKHKS